MNTEKSLALLQPSMNGTNAQQKLGLLVGISGLFVLVLALFGIDVQPKTLLLSVSLIAMFAGGLAYIYGTYNSTVEGIKNNGVYFSSLTSNGIIAWVLAIFITAFYIVLYWFPEYLGYVNGGSNVGVIALFDPLSLLLNGKPASQWFVYGTLYTVAILLFGVKYLFKYRHNRYQIFRTLSVMFFQLVFAYLIAQFMESYQTNGYYNVDLKNIWPLNYYFFKDWHVDGMLNGGNLGITVFFWGLILIFIATPVLTYFYGKRWYCSWVCGCGGLAETAGDPFRQISDKSNEAWQIERILIYSVLAFIVVVTALLLYDRFTEVNLYFKLNKFVLYAILGAVGIGLYVAQRNFYPAIPPKRIRVLIPTILAVLIFGFEWKFADGNILHFNISNFYEWYAFFIGAAFSGVVGVGFYPIMGSRVWCRFGCPQAAILGLLQKFFSRFRITTNGGQCISCGNCSTYCEMGIDVRSYAQKGQNIVRASCVGCGVCAAVCPRGVLKLENGAAINERTEIQPIIISKEEVNLLR